MPPAPRPATHSARPKNDNRLPDDPEATSSAVTLGPDERNYVFAVAMKYMKDEEAANDVTQDALLLAYRHRHSFRGDSRFSTWLYRVATTTALMHLRKRRRRSRELLVPQRVSDDEGSELSPCWQHRDPAPSPEARTRDAESMAAVRECLEQLGHKYEDVFWMRYYHGYSESEIASELGLNLTTVKTRAFRARRAVRAHLEALA